MASQQKKQKYGEEIILWTSQKACNCLQQTNKRSKNM